METIMANNKVFCPKCGEVEFGMQECPKCGGQVYEEEYFNPPEPKKAKKSEGKKK
jgi:predicted nucleic-acid-binding Zn-ribbon protein